MLSKGGIHMVPKTGIDAKTSIIMPITLNSTVERGRVALKDRDH